MYLFWAVVGLILESRCEENKMNSVIPELAKRILQKIDFPFFTDKIDTEFKNLSVIVCELAQDHSGVLKALNISAKTSPSDYTLLSIKTNQKLKNYEEAKAICISHLESSSVIDSSIWLSLLELLNYFDDGILFAKKILTNFETKCDVRGIRNAAMELKILYVQAYPESVADMLFNFTIELQLKPSTFNDAVYFLKKMNPEDILSFYIKVTDYINSVMPKL